MDAMRDKQKAAHSSTRQEYACLTDDQCNKISSTLFSSSNLDITWYLPFDFNITRLVLFFPHPPRSDSSLSTVDHNTTDRGESQRVSTKRVSVRLIFTTTASLQPTLPISKGGVVCFFSKWGFLFFLFIRHTPSRYTPAARFCFWRHATTTFAFLF